MRLLNASQMNLSYFYLQENVVDWAAKQYAEPELSSRSPQWHQIFQFIPTTAT